MVSKKSTQIDVYLLADFKKTPKDNALLNSYRTPMQFLAVGCYSALQ